MWGEGDLEMRKTGSCTLRVVRFLMELNVALDIDLQSACHLAARFARSRRSVDSRTSRSQRPGRLVSSALSLTGPSPSSSHLSPPQRLFSHLEYAMTFTHLDFRQSLREIASAVRPDLRGEAEQLVERIEEIFPLTRTGADQWRGVAP